MQQIIEYLRSEHDRYLEELKSFLTIPSISSSEEYKGEVARCAEHLADHLKGVGINNVKVSPTEGHPVVTGEWMGAAGRPTILVYGHYDVQPVDPLNLWDNPPFEPHVQGDRILARGAADDKGQLFMHIKAVEAILKQKGELPVNVKFLFEGEEEIGSPNLTQYLHDNKEALKADVVVVSDTDMWDIGIPAICYGLKGLTFLEIEMIGPNMDLHSGEYGGAIANPAEILARMLAAVKDENGRIQIPGFYDKVKESSAKETELLGKIPFDEEAYKERLGVEELWGEAPYTPLQRAWLRPTFEINGIWSGFIGKGAKTVLPSVANAKVSCRLVPDQDPDEIEALVAQYFIDNAPKTVKVKVTPFHGGKPFIVPLDNPYMGAAASALTDTFNHEPYFKRGGGSIPIVADFKEVLGLDTLLVGFGLPDCKVHSPNENFHLPTFYTGMEAIVRLMYNIGDL